MGVEKWIVLDPLTYLDVSDATKVWSSHGTVGTAMHSEQFSNPLKAVQGEDNVHYEAIEGTCREGPRTVPLWWTNPLP